MSGNRRAPGNGASDNVTGDAADVIEREVTSWPGVTTGDTGRGGIRFPLGRVEPGYLHGSRFADLPFPRKVRNELITEGRASVHPPLPNSGWARDQMENSEDVEDIVRLLRMNYNRAKERAERESPGGGGPNAGWDRVRSEGISYEG